MCLCVLSQVHDSDAAVRARFASYERCCAGARQLCVDEYRNWYTVPASKNKWGQFHAAQALCTAVLRARGQHGELQQQHKPSPLHRMCTPTSTIRSRLSSTFGCLRPVRWGEAQELVQTPPDHMQFSAEYEGVIYKLAGEQELKAFIANPTVCVRVCVCVVCERMCACAGERESKVSISCCCY